MTLCIYRYCIYLHVYVERERCSGFKGDCEWAGKDWEDEEEESEEDDKGHGLVEQDGFPC